MPKDITKDFFNKESQYVLFSGTDIGGNGAFRHLNDLFLMLYVLVFKKISGRQIFLAIDISILENLDTKTHSKQIRINGKNYTFLQYIHTHIDSENIIDVQYFEKTFVRGNNDLIFIASGHGAVQGLSIDRTKTFLSSDYFEDICNNDKNSTYLIMSQCQAGAYHHLDTRKDICVIGASEYQNSLSLPLKSMFNSQRLIQNFAFWDSVAINPLIFSLFLVILQINNHNVINNKKKNIINIFKFVASSTISYISAQTNNQKIIIPKHKISESNDDIILTVQSTNIQQPFLLNKILASQTML